MICQKVEVFVSAVHDGEEVLREAAKHIFGCEACRLKLKAYANMVSDVPAFALGVLPLPK